MTARRADRLRDGANALVVAPLIGLLAIILLVLIRAYQYMVSPVLGANCRYAPTCSSYAHDAVRTHGPVRGGWMAIKRIGRCHPWGGAGFDPVPDSKNTSPNR